MATIKAEDVRFLLRVCEIHERRLMMAPDLANAAGAFHVHLIKYGLKAEAGGGYTDVSLNAERIDLFETIIQGAIESPKGMTRAERIHLLDIGRRTGVNVPDQQHVQTAMALDSTAGLKDGLTRLNRWLKS